MFAIGAIAGHFLRAGAGASSLAQPLAFQQISDSPGVETEPSLSPDGKSVVYAQVAEGSSRLYLRRVGSRTPIPLTLNASEEDSQPAFSPDGERIAFRSERQGGGIFVMSATGESVKRLTDFGFNPSWSPDGKEIALSVGRFLSPTDRGSTALGLWAVNVATGEKRAVVKDVDAVQPSWSPHGARIAFWGLRGAGGQRDIWTVAADGSELERGAVEVTNDVAVDWSPAWSPDGRRLIGATTRPDGTSSGTAIYDLATQRFTLVPVSAGTWSPVWLPDSQRFLLRDTQGIWLVNPATQAKTLLISVGGYIVGRSLGVTRDGTWITCTETGTEGEIWLATMTKKAPTR